MDTLLNRNTAVNPAAKAASGQRLSGDVDEAIVRLDFDGDFAEVWTQRRSLAARLRRLGFVETDRQGRGVWLRGGIRQISFRKVVKSTSSGATKAGLAALARVNAARRRKGEEAVPVERPAVPEAVRA